jgi:hypothetical protein
MAGAIGVVAMGGYNTFCEILSFDKPALIVPRTAPRMEQFIRAVRAQELGLVRMLEDDGTRDARAMATALRHLPQQSCRRRSSCRACSTASTNVNRLVNAGARPAGGAVPGAWPPAAADAAPSRSLERKRMSPAFGDRHKIALLLKGYPRLSETFIAQEIRGARAARPRSY